MPRSVRIPLTQGLSTVVDADDVPLLEGYSWYAKKDHRRVYAQAYVRGSGRERQRYVLMHRLLLGMPSGIVDHINGDGLDNRKANLRLVSPRENARNRAKPKHPRATSKYKGVHRRKGAWRACIRVDGVNDDLGIFATEEEAAQVYDEAARARFGAFAVLNFPEEGERHAT